MPPVLVSITNPQVISGGVLVTLTWTNENTDVISDQYIDADLTGAFNPPTISFQTPYNYNPQIPIGTILQSSVQIPLASTLSGVPVTGYWLRINDFYTTGFGWFGSNALFFAMPGGSGGGGIPKGDGSAISAQGISFNYQGPSRNIREILYMIGPDSNFYSLGGNFLDIQLPDALNPILYNGLNISPNAVIVPSMPRGSYDAAIYIHDLDNNQAVLTSRRWPNVWQVS